MKNYSVIKPTPPPKDFSSQLIGQSPVWKQVLSDIHKLAAAPYMATLLLTGETGTGKEVVARAVHEASDRKHKSFMAVNCAAIPADLLESVLFGYEKGAFTGALHRTPGRFMQADGGTLLLDEVGDMPLPLQAKILRVLQEKEVDIVGGREPYKIDVRIIAASHQNLQNLVIQKRFREDLFYRLNVYPIELPPLRERKEDIPRLFAFFAQQLHKKGFPELQLTEAARNQLEAYEWPGNVRELNNLVQRLAISQGCTGTGEDGDAFMAQSTKICCIAPEHLPSNYRSIPAAPSRRASDLATDLPNGFCLDKVLNSSEIHYIKTAMRTSGGNITQAARMLGIHRTTLNSKLVKYKITIQDPMLHPSF
jgi:transcriptional regulator with GAF, ATPase, and Fis domain